MDKHGYEINEWKNLIDIQLKGKYINESIYWNT